MEICTYREIRQQPEKKLWEKMKTFFQRFILLLKVTDILVELYCLRFPAFFGRDTKKPFREKKRIHSKWWSALYTFSSNQNALSDFTRVKSWSWEIDQQLNRLKGISVFAADVQYLKKINPAVRHTLILSKNLLLVHSKNKNYPWLTKIYCRTDDNFVYKCVSRSPGVWYSCSIASI